MNKGKSASVFGASGLVGSFLVDLLAKDVGYSKILVANRKHIAYSSSKINEIIVDFNSLNSYPELFEVEELFVCIGTTIKKAGSKEKFKKVDFELPVNIANRSKQAGLNFFCLISSLGADASSSNFYSKVKGQTEDNIKEIGLANCYFVRPSLLLGNREENRTIEAIAQWWMKKLSFLFVGGLKKYKAIEAPDVAAAMLHIAKTYPKKEVILSDELHDYSTEYFKKK